MADQSLDDFAGPHPNLRLDDGHRVYAVGDIHGRLDLLADLHGRIEADMSQYPTRRVTIIHLGDYVDRGPDSSGVIDRLQSISFGDAATVFLRGNHEQYMIDYINGGTRVNAWIANGGLETMQSYGYDTYDPLSDDDARTFREKVPAAHRSFLNKTALLHQIGNLVFAHAGIDPTRPIDCQKPADLMWIREKFLNNTDDIGVLVVHGHTPRDVPELMRYRINVDTGAWFSGRLTAAVLEAGYVRFLATS